jgi:hypothetical protein
MKDFTKDLNTELQIQCSYPSQKRNEFRWWKDVQSEETDEKSQ